MPLIAVSMTGFCFPGIAADKTETNTKSAQINKIIEAEEYFEKANSLMRDEKYPEALKWFRKAAELGHPKAQYNLGVCYANGIGVQKDMKEAVRWFRKAAEQGIAEAQFSVGCYFLYEDGVVKNPEEAVRWFRKASEQGDVAAQYYLGACYTDGIGVQKDMAEAVKWLRKPAEQGVTDAQYFLGICYTYGLGVQKDIAEAVKWFRKAAEHGIVWYNLRINFFLQSDLEKCALQAKKGNAEFEKICSVPHPNSCPAGFHFWTRIGKFPMNGRKMIKLMDQIVIEKTVE